MDKEFIDFAKEQIRAELEYFSDGALSGNAAESMAEAVVRKIDWNNTALMHKGFSWIAQEYLKAALV